AKRFLTGLKPTGKQLHIGNYFGSIKQMIDLGKENPDSEFFLFLANMHGFTQIHDQQEMKENSIMALKLYLACGADAKQFVIYNPADIAGHAQLNWVLTCTTHMGFMERMHSYKEALDKGKAKEISVGVFCYPILMAADILLYDADIIPVGKDQKQHVEYARDIAQKFNKTFGETFKLPQSKINPSLGLIPGTDGRKMSKSYNNYIGLLDDEKTIFKRVKQIPTDTKAIEEPKNPDECNVYNLTKLFITAEEDKELRNKYEAGGLSYKDAKEYCFQKIMEFLKPIQERYSQISDQEVIDLLAKNAKYVNEIAEKKIQDVYRKIGFKL
ncbi:MAG TPA: tryptophan--tRNA ligase, partial [Candidatus Absconditabacterales bacterium]|nr:tryptophan--tRNA ligase [Candidatus Absconditabacterales bacterium]